MGAGNEGEGVLRTNFRRGEWGARHQDQNGCVVNVKGQREPGSC